MVSGKMIERKNVAIIQEASTLFQFLRFRWVPVVDIAPELNCATSMTFLQCVLSSRIIQMWNKEPSDWSTLTGRSWV